MFKLAKFTDEMKKAIFELCEEQTLGSEEYADEGEVKAMLDTAADELKKIRNGMLPVTSLYRYVLTVSDEYSKEILPPDEDENGLLYGECVYLASITADEYCSTDAPYKKNIERGYDIVYDFYSKQVIPVYRITISDEEVTSVYRVPADWIEDFCASEFIITLCIQLADKLRKGAAFAVKGGDELCA